MSSVDIDPSSNGAEEGETAPTVRGTENADSLENLQDGENKFQKAIAAWRSQSGHLCSTAYVFGQLTLNSY